MDLRMIPTGRDAEGIASAAHRGAGLVVNRRSRNRSRHTTLLLYCLAALLP
jgi:hypothetical protein